MKAKINFLFIAFLLLKNATSQTLVEHSQIWIGQPDNISAVNFENFITFANASEGMAKITAINSSTKTVSFSSTDFWPQGTWLHGYFERGQFWAKGGYVCPPIINIGFPSCHPLHRINDKMIRSLIHANHSGILNASVVAANIQTIKEGMDYMIGHQIFNPLNVQEDGGFTWWLTRSGETNIDDEFPSFNRAHAYETSHALRGMCEAYMYFQDYGISYSNMTGLHNAIVRAADNLAIKIPPLVGCDLENSNFKGLVLWALAGAYKVTQETKYLVKAKLLAELLMAGQTTDGSIQDGMWLTGGCDSDGCGVAGIDPCKESDGQGNNKIFHDTFIYYHCLILRGLVEMMDITPDSDVAWKITLIAQIKKAVNHIINFRIAYYEDAALNIGRGSVRSTWTTTDGSTTCPVWGYYYYEEVLETIAMLTLYSEFQIFFSCEERKILRNLLLTLGVQAHSTANLENFVSFACYADYFRAYENHERIFPGFESNNFISPFSGVTYYDNHTVPPGVESIEHPNEIDFTNLNVPAGRSLTVTSNVKIKSGPASRASSGSYFHAYITDAECPGLVARKGNFNNDGSRSYTERATAAPNAVLSAKDKNQSEPIPSENPTVSIKNQSAGLLTLMPNPSASGIFNVQIVNSEMKKIRIQVFNLLGETIYQTTYRSNNPSIDISTHPRGIYFVKITNGVEMSVQKIVYQ